MIPQNSIEFPVFQGILSESSCVSQFPHQLPRCFAVAEALALALAAVGHGSHGGHGSEIELERMALGFIHM